MKRCHFTESAESDLDAIADYNYTRWGLLRAERYIHALELVERERSREA